MHLWCIWDLNLNMISPLLQSCWGFSFALGHGVSPQSCSSTYLFAGASLFLDLGYHLKVVPVPHSYSSNTTLTNMIIWTTAFSSSMKLWAMPCWATQDGWVIVGNSEKTCFTGEENGKALQYSCLENPMNSMKRQNDRILKEELPRSVGAQYATGNQWRNNSTKNEGMEPKQKQYPVLDVTGDRSKVWCCKEQ